MNQVQIVKKITKQDKRSIVCEKCELEITENGGQCDTCNDNYHARCKKFGKTCYTCKKNSIRRFKDLKRCPNSKVRNLRQPLNLKPFP